MRHFQRTRTWVAKLGGFVRCWWISIIHITMLVGMNCNQQKPKWECPPTMRRLFKCTGNHAEWGSMESSRCSSQAWMLAVGCWVRWITFSRFPILRFSTCLLRIALVNFHTSFRRASRCVNVKLKIINAVVIVCIEHSLDKATRLSHYSQDPVHLSF